MPVATTESGVRRYGDGLVTAFSFSFGARSASHIKAARIEGNALVPLTGYTTVLNSDLTGGTLTFAVAPASGVQLYIYRETPQSQLVGLTSQIKYDPKVVQGVWDKMTYLIQELSSKLSRAVVTSPADDPQDLVDALFEAADRAEAIGIFDNRTDYLAWGGTVVTGRTYFVGGLPFIGLVGATATGLPGLMPHPKFPCTPDHFAENTTPGTTNMAAALNAALANASEVVMLPGRYRVNSTVTLMGRGKKLIGAGASLTFLETAQATGDVLLQDTAESQVYGQELRDFTVMAVSGVTRTSGALVACYKYPMRCIYENLGLRNFYDGFRLSGAQHSFFRGLVLDQYGIGTAGKGRIGFNFSVIDDEHFATDLHFSDIQVLGRNMQADPGLVAAFWFDQMDGVYVANSHTYDCDHGVVFSPGGTYAIDRCTSFKAVNCYFDAVAESHIKFQGTKPTTGAAVYSSFIFNGCTFRAAGGVHGAVHIDAEVDRPSFIGCDFYGNNGSGIHNPILTDKPRHLIAVGNSFRDNNGRNASGNGDIYWNGIGGNISGNVHEGGGSLGYAVALDTGAVGTDVSEENLSQSTYGRGVITFGTDCWIDGMQRGSNANGSWAKHKNGWMECWHRMVASSSGVVAWTFPQAFLTGTIPHVSREAEQANARVVAADIASATQLPNISVFNLSLVRQADAITLQASGVWK